MFLSAKIFCVNFFLSTQTMVFADDVLFPLLPFLPIDDLGACLRVSKLWRRISLHTAKQQYSIHEMKSFCKQIQKVTKNKLNNFQ